MRTADVCPTCSTYTNALCVIFDGPILTTLGVNPLDSLDVALNQLEIWATTVGVTNTLSEWAQVSGTRLAGNLIVSIGDYDATSNNTNITINDINQTIAISGNITNVNSIAFDTAPTAPTEVPGLLHWNAVEDTLDILANGVHYQLGQEMSPLVRNMTGVTITNGTPVMFAGTLGASGRVLVTPAVADGSIPSSYILGAATQDIANAQDGHVTTYGKVRDIDTTGTPYGEVWADSNILYVDPATPGGLTNVKPVAPNPQIFVGVVINAHATQGTIFVRPSWRGLITDLDDVNGTPLATSGQILVWDQAASYFDPDKNINDYQTKHVGYTVAGLAGLSPVIGDREYITDSVGSTFNTVPTGGGSVVMPVFYNGTQWLIG